MILLHLCDLSGGGAVYYYEDSSAAIPDAFSFVAALPTPHSNLPNTSWKQSNAIVSVADPLPVKYGGTGSNAGVPFPIITEKPWTEYFSYFTSNVQQYVDIATCSFAESGYRQFNIIGKLTLAYYGIETSIDFVARAQQVATAFQYFIYGNSSGTANGTSLVNYYLRFYSNGQQRKLVLIKAGNDNSNVMLNFRCYIDSDIQPSQTVTTVNAAEPDGWTNSASYQLGGRSATVAEMNAGLADKQDKIEKMYINADTTLANPSSTNGQILIVINTDKLAVAVTYSIDSYSDNVIELSGYCTPRHFVVFVSYGSYWLTPQIFWEDINNKPSAFTPSYHTHTKTEITDFPSPIQILNAATTLTPSGSPTDIKNMTVSTSTSIYSISRTSPVYWKIGGIAGQNIAMVNKGSENINIYDTDNTVTIIKPKKSAMIHVLETNVYGATAVTLGA